MGANEIISTKNLTSSNSKVTDNFSPYIDKIMSLHSFRKLSGKTQVILSLSAPAVRTRLTHTVEVVRIARELCKELGLNSDLSEAIALAHDVGHTPFGHVGERTLKEIMCGCDTLEGKVRDLDFDNSGFKHNLQSFRVLKDLEKNVINNEDVKWPYILWGIIEHTKPSYAKPDLSMENEIYISCGHCDLVYNCYFDGDSKICKRNKSIEHVDVNSNKKVCKPWYCAALERLSKDQQNRLNILERQKIELDDINHNKLDEEIKKIKRSWTNTYCTEPCYLSKLWNYKKRNNNSYKNFVYLFDHPFPNSFYSEHFNNFFFSEGDFRDCISVEAQVVKQADEIAQRQEDLEDGITKGLITRQEALMQVKKLFEGFRDHEKINKEIISKLEEIDIKAVDFQMKIGDLLLKFYKELVIESSKSNFEEYFNPKNKKKRKINYYCLLKILNEITGGRESEWLFNEINIFDLNEESTYQKQLLEIEKRIKDLLKDTFEEIDFHEAFLYLILYDFLENEIKQT